MRGGIYRTILHRCRLLITARSPCHHTTDQTLRLPSRSACCPSSRNTSPLHWKFVNRCPTSWPVRKKRPSDAPFAIRISVEEAVS
ncbi:uncharacterized protein LOC117641541 isoform X3 [Thrips palmi]|uniref:Uncharacterized protein LOC117641541 isoform X3 n=1 Tax=Thrips palmi TaxID=161013 RepID=A0A6P8YLN5_THRPL|nr:uncharacterized protein LOC117641541 isoform X3 [Thrips palmi]